METEQIEHSDMIGVAKLLKLAEVTIYNLIGRLGPDDGVVRLGSRCTRIIKPVFMKRLLAGKIPLRPKV